MPCSLGSPFHGLDVLSGVDHHAPPRQTLPGRSPRLPRSPIGQCRPRCTWHLAESVPHGTTAKRFRSTSYRQRPQNLFCDVVTVGQHFRSGRRALCRAPPWRGMCVPVARPPQTAPCLYIAMSCNRICDSVSGSPLPDYTGVLRHGIFAFHDLHCEIRRLFGAQEARSMNRGRRQIFDVGDDDVHSCVFGKFHRFRQFDFAVLIDQASYPKKHAYSSSSTSLRKASIVFTSGTGPYLCHFRSALCQ